jgi:hypothetical protein
MGLKSGRDVLEDRRIFRPYLFTPWNGVLLEKLIGFQLVNWHFMETKVSLPHSQVYLWRFPLGGTKISAQVRGFLCEYFGTRHLSTLTGFKPRIIHPQSAHLRQSFFVNHIH